jgi:hypothetical protein
MNLKTFGVTDRSKCDIVSHCVTSIFSFLNWHIVAYFFLFGTFLFSHCLTVLTQVMGVTPRTFVTLVTNVIVMCHWSSNKHCSKLDSWIVG